MANKNEFKEVKEQLIRVLRGYHPTENRKLPPSEYNAVIRADIYIPILVVLIVAFIILSIFFIAEAFDVPVGVVILVAAFGLFGLIRFVNNYRAAQKRERNVIVEQLGFRDQTPDDSDEINTSGILSGIYKGREFTIDTRKASVNSLSSTSWFTEIKTDLRNPKGFNLLLYEHQVKPYLDGEEVGEWKYNTLSENADLIQELLESHTFKEHFVRLGTNYIAANERTLLTIYRGEKPNVEQIRSFLDLTGFIAEKIEAFSTKLQVLA